jgi:hypothetical protein
MYEFEKMIDKFRQNLKGINSYFVEEFFSYLFDDNYHVEHVSNEIPTKILILQNK